MPQIQIIPSDLFSIFKWFKILFLFSFISSLLSFILLFTYYFLLKKKSTDDGSLTSEKPSSFILYFSTIFSSFSLIGSILCLYQYIKIFPISNLNTVSIYLYVSIISSIIILSINIYYLGNPNLCGDKKIYDYDLKMCIDKCNIGSYYNKEKKTCVIGCLSSNNCPANSICNSGQCCDLKNNQIINGFCCKNSYIFSVNGKDNICCPSNNMCGNVCCVEDSMICDSKTNTCLIKCGDQYCNNNQYCFVGPNISNTFSTIQTCVDKNSNCSLSSQNSIQYFPILEGNQHQFQPALLPSKDINDISNILTCDHFNTESDCSGFQNEFDSDRFYCGSESAIRFMSIPLKGNNCNQYTLSSFIPNNTLQANFINNDNKSLNILMDGNYSNPLSTYTVTQLENNNGYITSNTSSYTYKSSNILSNATLLLSSTSNCYNGKPTVYQPSCNTFQECITDNKCPFDADDDKECKNGIITPIIPVKKKCVPVFDDPVVWSYAINKQSSSLSIPYMYHENVKNYQWIMNDTRNLDISTPISDNSEITFQLIGAGSFDYNFLVCDDGQSKSPSMRETSFRWKLIKCGEQYYNSKNDYSIYPDSEYILNGQPLFIQVSDTETSFKNQYLSVNCDSNHPCIKPFSNDNNVYSLMWVIIQPEKLIGDPLETKRISYIIKAAPYGKYPYWSNNLIGSCGNCDWNPCLGFYKNQLKSKCKDISDLNSIYDDYKSDPMYDCTEDNCSSNKPDGNGNCNTQSKRLVTIFSSGSENSTECYDIITSNPQVVTYCCDNHLYKKFKTFLPNDLYDDNASLTTLICNGSDSVYGFNNPDLYSDCNCNKDCLESRNQN